MEENHKRKKKLEERMNKMTKLEGRIEKRRTDKPDMKKKEIVIEKSEEEKANERYLSQEIAMELKAKK
jgi:hypothetical protein